MNDDVVETDPKPVEDAAPVVEPEVVPDVIVRNVEVLEDHKNGVLHLRLGGNRALLTLISARDLAMKLRQGANNIERARYRRN